MSDIFTKEMKDAEHFITIQDFILVGSVDEYDTLLEGLKDLVCNKAKRGVCCRESFELVNGNIVESVEEMPFIVRLRIKTGFGTWSICGASIIASQFLLGAKHCLLPNFDHCI